MRVLIVRVGAMGDVLHALPAVAALRRAWPDAFVDWVVDERWQPLLDSDVRGPIVDVAFRVPIKAWKESPFSVATAKSLLEFRNLRKTNGGKGYDVVVDMQGTLRASVIGRLAGNGKLVGYRDPRESLAATFYGRKIQRRGAHVVEQGAALLGEACGVKLELGPVDLPREAWADNWAADLIANHRVCVLAPGAGWGAKRWPPERFGALAQQLHAMGFTVMVNAPREDDPRAAQVVVASAGAAQIVVCNVTGLIALLRRTALLVGGDSGPMHLAAALGVPLVALFGPTDPARNGPWGPGPKIVLRDPASATSYKRRDEVDPGLANLGIEAVLNAVSQLI